MRVTCLLIAAAIAAISPAPAAAKGKGTTDYSATLVTVKDGEYRAARVYCTKDRQRMEVDGEEPGSKSIIITRRDKDLVWMLITSKRMYMEMPMDGRDDNPLACGPDELARRKRLGRDTVDGHPAVKEMVSIRQGYGGGERLYYWTATDLGLPIKAASLDNSRSYTYKDIQVGRQDPELFEVPAGYQRMSGPPMTSEEPADAAAPDIPPPPVP